MCVQFYLNPCIQPNVLGILIDCIDFGWLLLVIELILECNLCKIHAKNTLTSQHL